MTVRELRPADVPACADLLASLPDWFGVEDTNRGYIAALGRLPAAVVVDDDDVIGFVALELHGPRSAEILVMAAARDRHRTGVGTALVGWAKDWCRFHDFDWLHVKTRGPSTPDAGYERTRHFYLAMGFEPLFETTELWGPENAALILVMRVT